MPTQLTMALRTEGEERREREGHHKLIQSQWAIWRIYLRKFVNLNIFDRFYIISIYLNYRHKEVLENFPR